MAASTVTAATMPISSSLPLASTATSGQLSPPPLCPASSTRADTSKGVGRGTSTAVLCAGQGQDTTTTLAQGNTWKPALCVILVELFDTGTILLGKVALDGGIGKWKELDKKALGWLFTNAFAGYTLPMALYYYGLRDTTASYTVLIFSSLMPLFTFVLSVLLGMENMRLKSKEGSAKVIGALVCFGGALLISLYNGKELHLWHAIISSLNNYNGADGGHHLRGTLLLLGDCIIYAFWYPIQVKALKVYPWKHWASVLTCVIGGLQSYVIGIFFRRDKLAWQIGWNIQLLSIVYSAALGTAAKYWLNLYAIEKWGPVFPPMFNTLSTIFTMILGTLLLGESLTVGSLLGSALVFGGLYIYLYGKAK